MLLYVGYHGKLTCATISQAQKLAQEGLQLGVT
jgi:hypothetical protein